MTACHDCGELTDARDADEEGRCAVCQSRNASRPKPICVKVTTRCGDSWVTSINATLEEARAYFIGPRFNIGDGPRDRMVEPISVELI